MGLMSRNTDDPQHWRDRAAKFRALAAAAGSHNVATLMMDLAAEYEQLAENPAADKKPPLKEPPEPSREQRE